MERKLFVWLIVVSLMAGCIGQSKPTPTPSPTPVNNPPMADFSYSWTGGDKEQPWTCSKITFKADVSDPDGDKTSLMWHDNNNALFQFLGKSSFETKLWPDGLHTIKLTATDDKGAKTVVEKQINVKYEVPEPIPVKKKDGVNISTIYVPTGVEPQTHEAYNWLMSTDTPLLGYYDLTNPITVDWHIKWALEHGINTFWLLEVPRGNPPDEVYKGSWMTYYRDGFLKAKYRDRIKFMIFLDTRLYNPFSYRQIQGESLERDSEILSKYFFNQPNYYKINGKPVVYFYVPELYLCVDCDNKREREKLLKFHIESFRKNAKKYNFDLFLIGDVVTEVHDGRDDFIIENFDAITTYHLGYARYSNKYKWKTDEKGRKVLIAPYDDMVEAAVRREIELSELASKKGKTYIPFVEQGFNCEKRSIVADYQEAIVNRTNPTPQKYEEFLTRVKPLIDPKLNILLTIWNEFSEGNAIEPTREFGFAYLDIIRDNFAIKPTSGWPPNIVPTKNCGCAEYKGWNTEIGMPPFVFAFVGAENELLKALKMKRVDS